MTRFRLALAAALTLAALGCHKTLGPPSPDFQAANAKYLEMLSNDGPVDVFTDPGIAEVQALLAKVPADSVDSDAAKALKDTIAKGVAEAEKAAADRKAAQAAAAKPVSAPIPLVGEEAPSEAAAPTAQATGEKGPEGPVAGMSFAEFQSRFGACFSKDTPFTDQSGKHGDAYALSTTCQAKYPALANQWVLIAGDAVLGVVPKGKQQQLTLGNAPAQPAPKQQVAQAQPVAAQPPAPPPPPNPNAVDRKVAAPAEKIQVAPNLNSDLDARSKLPGQP